MGSGLPLQADVDVANLTTEEVARHAAVGDCWSIFQGRVYDVGPSER